ncbi:collagen-like domain-containing protein [Flavobacterium bizetiae]|uniref:hypothetical protein n=1 Tax=Flavobacterium bizetiae TaxID=2704140 RepID=UPI00375634BD
MELKNTFYGIICSLSFTTVTYSQVGIGTLNPDQSSQLDISATNKGLLVPRVQLTQLSLQAPIIGTAATSLLVFNTQTINDVTPGFYFWNGIKWVRMINKDDIATFKETVTSLVYDASTQMLTYKDEDNNWNEIKLEGLTGPQGEIGPQGLPGTNGVDGLVGPQGLPGTNGVDGLVGPEGPQGPEGEVGPQGLPGTNGVDGLVGPQGPQGEIGPQGLPGTNGVDGLVGPQGLPGTNGVDGLVGPQGPQGLPGTNGVDGLEGPQGPQGLPGTNGVDGLVGAQGLQGEIGPQGLPGTNGADGLVGPQGPQGLPGTNGVDGLEGPQGPQGLPGTNGADGLVGPEGPQGPAGLAPSLGAGNLSANDYIAVTDGSGTTFKNTTIDLDLNKVKTDLATGTLSGNGVIAIDTGNNALLNNATVKINPGTSGQILTTNSTGAVQWQTPFSTLAIKRVAYPGGGSYNIITDDIILIDATGAGSRIIMLKLPELGAIPMLVGKVFTFKRVDTNSAATITIDAGVNGRIDDSATPIVLDPKNSYQFIIEAVSPYYRYQILAKY